MYSPKFEFTPKMVEDLLSIERYRSSLEFLDLPTRVKQEMVFKAKVKRTHFSTSIEGNVLSYDQVERVINQKSLATSVNAEREVLNYWDALTKLEEWSRENRPITVNFITDLHNVIVKKGNRPSKVGFRGATRPGILFAVYDSSTGTIDYIPPEWSDVPQLVEDLVNWYHNEEKLPVPVRAAIFHYQLATIHPFDDGNGRCARAMATYILMEHGYDFKGFNSMEEYYASDLAGYYANLQMDLPALYYDGRNDPPHLERWIEYFVHMMALNAQGVYDAAVAARSDNPSSELVRSLSKKDKKMLRYVLEKRLSIIKTPELAELFMVSTRSMRRWCKDWVTRGILVAHVVNGRVMSYSLAEAYAAIDLHDLGFADEEDA